MAESSHGGNFPERYGSWTVCGSGRGVLAKLRALDSPTTALSIGMESSLGDSGSGNSSLRKTLSWSHFDSPLSNSSKRKRDFMTASSSEEPEIVLALGSSPPGSSLNNMGSSPHGASLNMGLGLGRADSVGSGNACCSTSGDSELQLGLGRMQDPLSLGLSRGMDEDFLGLGQASEQQLFPRKTVDDEGSSSARWRTAGGVMPSLLQQSRNAEQGEHLPQENMLHHQEGEHYPSENEEVELDMNPTRSTKACQSPGCEKGARGASGLCIAHGGGRRCKRPGCNKGAEGRTAYCKAHGGGRRCQSLGCTKSAEGKTEYCIGHGGGRRCCHEGCSKAARGRSGLCIRHGGGKRCQQEGCTRSAEGFSGLCISHGGGRRCQILGCTKGAQGSTMYCKAHGGGKRCTFDGCGKGAEGSTSLCKAHGGGKRCMFEGGGICPKSVHGGTQFCVAHGGGKRCAVEGCSKSARGRTAHCVRHGGGKRCKMEGCGKSAQGSTDFCKAHGGGKRCTWAQVGSGPPCEKFARGKLGLCANHSSMVQDDKSGVGGLGTSLFSGLVSRTTSTVTSNSTQVSFMEKKEHTSFLQGHWSGAQRQNMRVMAHSAVVHHQPTVAGDDGTPYSVPEGRVHGGGLLALLAQGGSQGG